ncbi:zinc finger protein, putative [Ixodes scapularis]|uniref:Zinc finger protein, putative n=1 Tax=Ixodes scapularis TaxID=6945 RepID=B7QAR1_IXOSC|nr:zinc finger protein, putative [Ixodes scapularis]|eukprot:XP_002412637.1 zinc finger protein, putative [Ixodes scapularis]
MWQHSYEETAPGVAAEFPSCYECGCFFPDRELLSLHLKEAHNSRKGKFECSRCPYSSVNKFDVKRHERIHTGEKPFQCRFCNRAFNQSSTLISHRRTHTGERPYRCGRCDRGFSRKGDMQRHWNRSHEEIVPDVELSSCNEYGVVSPTGELPSLHPRDVNGSRKGRFACGYCPYSSNIKCNVVRHERVHTGEKPFQCRQCNRAFTQSSALLSHRRTHTAYEEIAPGVLTECLSCDECGCFFPNRDLLSLHLKEAHDSRKGKFECSRCPYTSIYKFDVKRHERIHTGEKPFQCRFCNRAFAQSSNLISHRRTHTGERPYRCGRCDRGFSRRCDMQRHWRRCDGFV